MIRNAQYRAQTSSQASSHVSSHSIFEALEDRRMFAVALATVNPALHGTILTAQPTTQQDVTVTYDQPTRTLTVNGTDNADTVRLIAHADNADRTRILGQFDKVLFQGGSSTIDRIVVNLKGGDDSFELTTGAPDIYIGQAFDINLGSGRNVARIDLSQTTFRQGYGNANWTMNLNGGGNQDDVTALLGRRTGGSTTLTARLDEGADAFTSGITGNTDDGMTHVIVYGGYGADVLTGGVEADRFFGEGGNDILRGGAGNDYLNGGAEKDEINGEDGNDYLDGGQDGVDADQDILTGGSGIDTFRFYSNNPLAQYGGSSQDLIVDMQPGESFDYGLVNSL